MSIHTYYWPAPIAAVKVTTSNVEQVAEWCGGKVTRHQNKRGTMVLCVEVAEVSKGTSTNFAYPGMYLARKAGVLKSGEIVLSYAIFGSGYFEGNFDEDPLLVADKTWGQL